MNITLRPLQPSDAPLLAEYANNFNIWVNLRDMMPHPYSLQNAQDFIEMDANISPGHMRRVIAADGQFVGMIGVHGFQDVNRFGAELGYWVAEPYWGRGIVTRAIPMMLGLAFEAFPTLHRIQAEVYAYNAASRRVLEKNGFTLEGHLKDSVFKHGKFTDSYLFRMLRSEFEAGQASA